MGFSDAAVTGNGYDVLTAVHDAERGGQVMSKDFL